MNEYNDYIAITRRWLKDYNLFKVTVKNMNKDIEAQQQILDMGSAAPVAKYGDIPKGGSPELNAVEMAADDRIKRQQDIYKAVMNRDDIQRHIDRIDSAIDSLEDEDREVLQEHYLQGDSWEHIGHNRHYSEQWARKKGGKALRQVAFILFGLKAKPPEQIRFVFAQ